MARERLSDHHGWARVNDGAICLPSFCGRSTLIWAFLTRGGGGPGVVLEALAVLAVLPASTSQR